MEKHRVDLLYYFKYRNRRKDILLEYIDLWDQNGMKYLYLSQQDGFVWSSAAEKKFKNMEL